MASDSSENEELVGTLRGYLNGISSRDEVRKRVVATCHELAAQGASPERILVVVKGALDNASDGMDRSEIWERHDAIQDRLARWVLSAYFDTSSAARESGRGHQ